MVKVLQASVTAEQMCRRHVAGQPNEAARSSEELGCPSTELRCERLREVELRNRPVDGRHADIILFR